MQFGSVMMSGHAYCAQRSGALLFQSVTCLTVVIDVPEFRLPFDSVLVAQAMNPAIALLFAELLLMYAANMADAFTTVLQCKGAADTAKS